MPVGRFNPFKGLAHPRRVFAWGMFDLANQSFTLLINTLFFGLFFKQVIAGDPANPAPGTKTNGDFLWGLTVALSMLAVVVLSPILGALADCTARKKRMMLTTGVVCAVFTAAFALLPSGNAAGQPIAMAPLIIAMVVYGIANIAFNLGENFLGSFLPEICTRQQMGRVSATGWAMGYTGALILLIISAVVASVFKLNDAADFRPFFVFAGMWFLLALIPTAIGLPEIAKPTPLPPGSTAAGVAFARIKEAIHHAKNFPDLSRLLIAFLVYGFGVQTIVFFAGVIAKDDFGFNTTKLVLFTLQLTVTAGIGAVATGLVQDKLGHKRTLLIILGIWIATAIALAGVLWYRSTLAPGTIPAEWPLWIVGNGIGLGLGGVGTGTRALVGYFTPAHRTAEFFSLWGLTYKLAGAVGVLAFGTIRSTLGSVPSMIALSAFFIVGGAILLIINEDRGKASAEDAERDHSAVS